MQIKEAKIYIVDTGGLRPVLVELVSDTGESGIGEAAVGFGVGCHASAVLIRDMCETFLLGKDPRRIGDIWNDLYYHTFWGKGGGPIFFSAVSAIETALWDMKGKMLGVPVYELLGGKQRDHIHVYANGLSRGETPESFAEMARKAVNDGFDAVKIYPLNLIDPIRHINNHFKNRDVDRASERLCVEKVRAVREAIGPDRSLLVDLTAEGTTDTMIRIGKALEPFEPYHFEEPVDAFDVDAHLAFRSKVNIPIATGERLYTRYGFRRLIELRAVDIVQPDPGTTGGLMEAFKIGAFAETYSMRIAPHNFGGPVLTAACVQLSACLSNFAIQEIFPYQSDMHYSIVTKALEKTVSDGYLPVPEEAGLGVTLNYEVVDPFITAHLF